MTSVSRRIRAVHLTSPGEREVKLPQHIDATRRESEAPGEDVCRLGEHLLLLIDLRLSARLRGSPRVRKSDAGQGWGHERGARCSRFLTDAPRDGSRREDVCVFEHLHRKMGTFVSWRICALHLARRSSVRRRREGARARSRSIGVFIKTRTLLQQQLAGF